jgi:ElaB/YqjD/DUF883 family membrane-anchored ribosome-binding protein
MNILPLTSSAKTDSIAETGEEIKGKISQALESGKQSATSCCTTIRDGSNQICESTADNIRKNPIAYVAGAAFLGAAVCYLILEGRSQPTLRERYLSEASDSLRSVGNSIKFW